MVSFLIAFSSSSPTKFCGQILFNWKYTFLNLVNNTICNRILSFSSILTNFSWFWCLKLLLWSHQMFHLEQVITFRIRSVRFLVHIVLLACVWSVVVSRCSLKKTEGWNKEQTNLLTQKRLVLLLKFFLSFSCFLAWAPAD